MAARPPLLDQIPAIYTAKAESLLAPADPTLSPFEPIETALNARPASARRMKLKLLGHMRHFLAEDTQEWAILDGTGWLTTCAIFIFVE